MAQIASSHDVYCFETQLGWMAVVESADRVRQVTFGHRSAAAAMQAVNPLLLTAATPAKGIPEIAKRLRAFAAGAEDDFLDVQVDLSFASPFQRRVIQRCRRIAYGETLSYGELAAAVGSPGAARAVGNVMAANRYPLIVPCHRVVNSDGSLGNYSAPQGPRMKARLLELEGANVLASVEAV